MLKSYHYFIWKKKSKSDPIFLLRRRASTKCTYSVVMVRILKWWRAGVDPLIFNRRSHFSIDLAISALVTEINLGNH